MTEASSLPPALPPILSVEGVSIALPPGADRPFAVQDMALELRAGEVTCLVGESGSGKSMIAKALMGLLPPRVRVAKGRLMFGGEDIVQAPPARMRALRAAEIGMVFQEPMTALNPLHRVGRQVAEVLKLHTRMGRTERRARVLELFQQTRLPDPERILRSYPHQLSGGQRQRVVIAMALALRPKLLIADEPTTALDVTTQAQILHLLRNLQREQGTAVLFITHDFGVVAEIADRVAVMQKGLIVEQGPAARVLEAPTHPYTQALLAAVPRLEAPAQHASPSGPVLLDAVGVNKTYRRRGFRTRINHALSDVSMELRRGETLGIVGESGSGKSTLARIMTCLAQADNGEIRLEGTDIGQLSRRALRPYRKRIQMVFQDPYASLDPRQSVKDIIAEGPIIHGESRAVAEARALELLALVGLDASAAKRYPHEFSGGQRQRIGIARALALRPEILVADEPVSALDVSVQAQVLELLADIKKRLGLSMIFVTHDLRVAFQISDRIAVMQSGKVVELGTAEALYRDPQAEYTRRLFAAIPGGHWGEQAA